MIKRGLVTLLVVCGFAATAQAEEYTIDPAHSSVGFSVRHLAISKVRGSFGEFEGTIDFNSRDTSSWTAEVVIQTASIDTHDDDRDKHLSSPDFFNATEHPTMTFKSSRAIPGKNGKFDLKGELTIHGVTKPVTLKVEMLGAVTDPWGNQRVGFTATTTINRLDYDMKWSKTMEAGGLVVGHDVEITLEIEAVLATEEDEKG